MSETDEMGLTLEAAQGYEQFFVPAIFSQWPARILEAADVGIADRVITHSVEQFSEFCDARGAIKTPLNAILAKMKKL